ncbi:hypothetical protein H5410_064898 [Solanum commersonii]|uniref:Uncharacterized protein n=1 Tax=Solanum commersonii TaxID=4109 RepID=A0A9J5VY33_SOLCO|nr:hypothetical protein H5410_064898 [Solanum commersonii]
MPISTPKMKKKPPRNEASSSSSVEKIISGKSKAIFFFRVCKQHPKEEEYRIYKIHLQSPVRKFKKLMIGIYKAKSKRIVSLPTKLFEAIKTMLKAMEFIAYF